MLARGLGSIARVRKSISVFRALFGGRALRAGSGGVGDVEAEGNTSVLYCCPCNDGVSIAVGYRRGHTGNAMYHTGMHEVWVRRVWGIRGRNKYTRKYG